MKDKDTDLTLFTTNRRRKIMICHDVYSYI